MVSLDYLMSTTTFWIIYIIAFVGAGDPVYDYPPHANDIENKTAWTFSTHKLADHNWPDIPIPKPNTGNGIILTTPNNESIYIVWFNGHTRGKGMFYITSTLTQPLGGRSSAKRLKLNQNGVRDSVTIPLNKEQPRGIYRIKELDDVTSIRFFFEENRDIYQNPPTAAELVADGWDDFPQFQLESEALPGIEKPGLGKRHGLILSGKSGEKIYLVWFKERKGDYGIFYITSTLTSRPEGQPYAERMKSDDGGSSSQKIKIPLANESPMVIFQKRQLEGIKKIVFTIEDE